MTNRSILPTNGHLAKKPGVACSAWFAGVVALSAFTGCARNTYPVLYDFVLNPSFTGNTASTRQALGVESVSSFSYDTTKTGRTLWQEDIFDKQGRLQKRIVFDLEGQPEQTSYYEYLQDGLPLRTRTESSEDTSTLEYFYSEARQPQKSVLKFGRNQEVEFKYQLYDSGKQLRAEAYSIRYPGTDSAASTLAFTDVYMLNKMKQPEMRVQLSSKNDTLAKHLLSYSKEGRLLTSTSFQFHRIEIAQFVYDRRGLLIAKHYSRNGKYIGSDAFEYKFRE